MKSEADLVQRSPAGLSHNTCIEKCKQIEKTKPIILANRSAPEFFFCRLRYTLHVYDSIRVFLSLDLRWLVHGDLHPSLGRWCGSLRGERNPSIDTNLISILISSYGPDDRAHVPRRYSCTTQDSIIVVHAPAGPHTSQEDGAKTPQRAPAQLGSHGVSSLTGRESQAVVRRRCKRCRPRSTRT